jgi:hypothetical protein
MKILTIILDIATGMLRLLEAEGRILRRSIMRVGWAIAFMAIASVLVLAAAGFLLVGIYQYLAAQLSPAAASLLVSLPALVLAVIFAGIVNWWTNDPK